MAGFNYAQNIIGLKKGAGDIHELELEVAQLSASVLDIKGDVDNIDNWGTAEELLSDTGFKVYGYKNDALKLAFLKLRGTANTPSSVSFDQAIDTKYRPITESEVFNVIRYNGDISVRGDNCHLVLNVNNAKNWQTGTLMYPTRN